MLKKLCLSTAVVLGVGADPEPDKIRAVLNGHGAVSDSHTYGEDRLHWINLFESKTRVGWICPKQKVGLPSLSLDVVRKVAERGAKRLRSA